MDSQAQQLATRLTAAFNGGGAASARPWLWRPLLQLLAQGRPVTVEQIAQATGRTPDQVRGALAANPDTEYDESGRITGSGLTQNPTPHHFEVDGRKLYTWCALDTLIFPAVLGRPARVTSPCHATGTPVRLTVEPDQVTSVEPTTAVVSIVPTPRPPSAPPSATRSTSSPPPTRARTGSISTLAPPSCPCSRRTGSADPSPRRSSPATRRPAAAESRPRTGTGRVTQSPSRPGRPAEIHSGGWGDSATFCVTSVRRGTDHTLKIALLSIPAVSRLTLRFCERVASVDQDGRRAGEADPLGLFLPRDHAGGEPDVAQTNIVQRSPQQVGRGLLARAVRHDQDLDVHALRTALIAALWLLASPWLNPR
ncbi:organomercurial lyase MerB [Pseudonocardia sp. D17]|uniref:organomercurial lyase MerB n=1 Tax=Pseudonocardia sp. D17 TaxID=882661 RepID=UPI0002D34055